MECEICGRVTERIIRIEIEGSKMDVCPSCAKYGKKLMSYDPEAGMTSPHDAGGRWVFNSERKPKEHAELQLADNFGQIIRSARERKKLSCKELALAIAEQESYLDRVEKQKTLPDERLIRKVEKFLGIKLYEEVAQQQEEKQTKAGAGRYLGDFVKED